MVSQNIDKALQQAKSLGLDERQQFIEMLRAQPIPEQTNVNEETIAQSLLQKGIIRKIPAKPTAEDMAQFNAWKPVKVEGRPVSETLIEERR